MGNTTTIKTIIWEERQEYGLIMTEGNEVKSSISETSKLIGYCPQQDSLWKEMTLREQLYLFATIRGILSKDV